MSKNYEKLILLLKELFQFDRADLDFGIFRISIKTLQVSQRIYISGIRLFHSDQFFLNCFYV